MDLNQRLNSIINKDKKTNPKYLLNVIKSDFYYMINNYFEVDFDSIKIDLDLQNNKYTINIDCQGERIKLMQSLP